MQGKPFQEALVDVPDEGLKDAQADWLGRMTFYARLGEFEALQLKPACAFWRLAMRTIFEDYKTVVEIPPGNDLPLFELPKKDPMTSRAN